MAPAFARASTSRIISDEAAGIAVTLSGGSVELACFNWLISSSARVGLLLLLSRIDFWLSGGDSPAFLRIRNVSGPVGSQSPAGRIIASAAPTTSSPSGFSKRASVRTSLFRLGFVK